MLWRGRCVKEGLASALGQTDAAIPEVGRVRAASGEEPKMIWNPREIFLGKDLTEQCVPPLERPRSKADPKDIRALKHLQSQSVTGPRDGGQVDKRGESAVEEGISR